MRENRYGFSPPTQSGHLLVFRWPWCGQTSSVVKGHRHRLRALYLAISLQNLAVHPHYHPTQLHSNHPKTQCWPGSQESPLQSMKHPTWPTQLLFSHRGVLALKA